MEDNFAIQLFEGNKVRSVISSERASDKDRITERVINLVEAG